MDFSWLWAAASRPSARPTAMARASMLRMRSGFMDESSSRRGSPGLDSRSGSIAHQPGYGSLPASGPGHATLAEKLVRGGACGSPSRRSHDLQKAARPDGGSGRAVIDDGAAGYG